MAADWRPGHLEAASAGGRCALGCVDHRRATHEAGFRDELIRSGASLSVSPSWSRSASGVVRSEPCCARTTAQREKLIWHRRRWLAGILLAASARWEPAWEHLGGKRGLPWVAPTDLGGRRIGRWPGRSANWPGGSGARTARS